VTTLSVGVLMINLRMSVTLFDQQRQETESVPTV
jgi:hypothetical protein